MEQPMKLDEFMTTDTLAKSLGVSKHVVSRWVRDLGLPVIKIGAKPIVHEPAVAAWLKSREKVQSPESA